SSSAGDSNSATMQHTSGSSASQSNSFSTSASLGFFGDLATGGLTVGSERMEGSERSKASTVGTDAGASRDSGTSDSMSLKDWACYTYIDEIPSLTWVWGQEYPWDVIRYQPNGGQLPKFVSQLLWDGTQLLPP